MVVLIVTSIHPDFDKRVWRHARALAAAGHEVHLICPWDVAPGSKLDGVEFHPFKRVHGRAKRPFLIPWRIYPLMARLSRRVDIIHFHDIDLLPLMMIARCFRPVVYDVHENYPDEMLVRYWVPWMLRRPLYWLVKAGQYLASFVIKNIVLVVPDQEKDFPNHYVRKLILRNYASLTLVNDAQTQVDRPYDVAFIGSQYRENGTFLVLEIAKCLKDAGFKSKFLCSDIFADQSLRYEFLQTVRRLDLADYIILAPSISPGKILEILHQARIGLLPNLRVPKQEKALPTKLFEYMAAGLPIVASDLPLLKYYVSESRCGLLAQPESPNTFADAIKQLLNDELLAAQLGSNGRNAFVKRFSWESQIPDLVEFYKCAIK